MSRVKNRARKLAQTRAQPPQRESRGVSNALYNYLGKHPKPGCCKVHPLPVSS